MQTERALKSASKASASDGSILQTARRSLLHTPTAMFGLVVLTVMVIAAATAPFIGLQSPESMNLTEAVQAPSARHLLGTDSFGRDLLSRIIYGAQVSLFVALGTTALSFLIGAPLGIISGFRGGLLDSVVSRIMDALFSFPPILLAIALVGTLGAGVTNVIVALTLVYTPGFARQARTSSLLARRLDFVEAARAIGARERRIMFLHVLPAASGPLIVRATVLFSYAIVAEAGLSFLGLGVRPPTPSWGQMLNEARGYLETSPWYPLVPGLTIVLAVLSPSLLGDWLQRLIDPRQRQRLD